MGTDYWSSINAIVKSCACVPQSLQNNIFFIHMEYIFSNEIHFKNQQMLNM